MSEYDIEKGVSYIRGAHHHKYPFRDMEVGDSFFASCEEPLAHRKIVQAASYFGTRNNRKYSVLKVDGGYRVWRTK